MSSYQCPECGPEWNGDYTMEHRCVTCGSVILAAEPWREESDETIDMLAGRFISTAARTKWRHLQEQGYNAFHIRETGIVFGTSLKGEAGHISWWGKVTWLSDGRGR